MKLSDAETLDALARAQFEQMAKQLVNMVRSELGADSVTVRTEHPLGAAILRLMATKDGKRMGEAFVTEMMVDALHPACLDLLAAELADIIRGTQGEVRV